mgnify:CR=1 FL=1
MGPENDAEPIVNEIQAAWAAAFRARDFEAMASLYTQTALFFGSTAALYCGRGGVKTYFATLRHDITLDEFERFESIELRRDLIIAAGYWRFTFGTETRPYRLSWTIVRDGDAWKIASHHASPRG